MVSAWTVSQREATMTSLALSGYDALAELVDDSGIRYELIDGAIVVNPPPGFAHGDVLAEVAATLRVHAPAGISVLVDYGFYYAEPSFVIPDFLVAPRADCQEKGIFVAPLLVVEVHSPSTRRRDRTEKQAIYAEAGVPSYWLIEPHEPSLRVLSLINGGYVETAVVRGTEPLAVDVPFPVTVRLRRS